MDEWFYFLKKFLKKENILYWGNRGGMTEFCLFLFCIFNSKFESIGFFDYWSWNYVFSVFYEIIFIIKKIVFIFVLGNFKNFYVENFKNFNVENLLVLDLYKYIKVLYWLYVCVLVDFWNGVLEGLKLSFCSEYVVLIVVWECVS